MHPCTSHCLLTAQLQQQFVCNLDPHYAPEGCRVSWTVPGGYLVRGWQGQLLWPPSGVPRSHRCADITQLFSYVTRVTLTGFRNTQLIASDRWRPPGGGYVQLRVVANMKSGGAFEQTSSKHQGCFLTFSPWFIIYKNWNTWLPIMAKTHLYVSSTTSRQRPPQPCVKSATTLKFKFQLTRGTERF